MSLNYKNFTNRARQAVSDSRAEAERLNHDYIGTEHILLGILSSSAETIASSILNSMGVDLHRARIEVAKITKQGDNTAFLGELPLTDSAKRLLEQACLEASNLEHTYVGTEHLLIALTLRDDTVAAMVLSNLGITLKGLHTELYKAITGEGPTMEEIAQHVTKAQANKPSIKPTPVGPSVDKTKTPILDSFSRDLTRLASLGRLDPCVGRTAEIKRVMQILVRRTKNNPVLIGEAGVGKTAIAEGLAQLIQEQKAPSMLLGKRIVELDLAMMVAGTKYRGQFEERLKGVMQEVVKAKNVIIFIDELHTLIGSGGAEGALDAANTLKPALARGEIQCIGATTATEFRKYIEKDSALSRRFQQVVVNEPTTEDCIKILHGLKSRYEKHHGVIITDEAIEAAVQLSSRYISDRFLPDKAIDVIDEAGSKLRIDTPSEFPEIKELEDVVDMLDRDKEQAVSTEAFKLAAEYKARKDILVAKIQKLKETSTPTIIGNITAEDVRQIISGTTGIPIKQMDTTEKTRLLEMETELHKRIISQDEAVTLVSKSIRKARAGVKDPNRPIACFLFLGPTGVGKTLMAKTVAEYAFGKKDALIQCDMSEYMEKHAVSKMIGAPPGYIGYEDAGKLTETVRKRPYSVILLDEIEKADPDIFNIFLQVMEDGKLTDGQGRTVDFKNTIIMMTSNVGANVVKNKGGIGFSKKSDSANFEQFKTKLEEEVKKAFRPEFLNRLDAMIFFKPLGQNDISQIAEIEFNKVADRLKQNNINIIADKTAIEFLSVKGFDPDYGARPMRRSVEKHVEDMLTEALMKDQIKPGDTVLVFKDGENLACKVA